MPYLNITTQSQLKDYCQQLVRSPSIALDTEFVSERSYRPLLCLVQVAADSKAIMVAFVLMEWRQLVEEPKLMEEQLGIEDMVAHLALVAQEQIMGQHLVAQVVAVVAIMVVELRGTLVLAVDPVILGTPVLLTNICIVIIVQRHLALQP